MLEIGTGYGWQTALLARLAEEVWSVERLPDVAETARQNLRRHGAEPAHVVVGDGTEGLAEHSPFDAILVAAAFPTVPPPLITQLADGGRLVMPMGPGGQDTVVQFVKVGDRLLRTALSSWRTSSGSSADMASMQVDRRPEPRRPCRRSA